MLDQDLFFAHLRAHGIGMPLTAVESMESTNQFLLDQASQKAPEGALAVAEMQTAGRGRHRRLWHSPAGRNLYFSVLLWPSVPMIRFSQLAMLTALALRRAVLSQMPEAEIALKWPNDLWLNGRKLSGILCECPPEEVEGKRGIVLGIGLNVNSLEEDFPPELRTTATSMRWSAGRQFSREKTLAEFCNAFQELYDQWQKAADITPFLAEWKEHDALAGKTITVQRTNDTLVGTVEGYSPEGLMRFKTADGIHTISAGDIHIGTAGVR